MNAMKNVPISIELSDVFKCLHELIQSCSKTNCRQNNSNKNKKVKSSRKKNKLSMQYNMVLMMVNKLVVRIVS